MSAKYKTYEKFGNILVEDVLAKLTASHPSFERIHFDGFPSNNVLIGTLGAISNIDDDEEEGTSSTVLFPNSLTAKFLVEDFSSAISLDLKFYLYYRVYPTFEEQKNNTPSNRKRVRFCPIWKREEVKESVLFNEDGEISLSNKISEVIEKIKKDPDLLRNNDLFDVENLEDEEKFDNFLRENKKNELPDLLWDVKLKFNSKVFSQNNDESVMIEIQLINESIIPDVNKDKNREDEIFYDSFLFNPILEISLGNNCFKRFKYKVPNSNDKYYFSDLRCLNCQGEYDSKRNIIITKNYGSICKNKEAPKNKIEGMDITFRKLSTEKGLEELEKIYQSMEEFYENSTNEDHSYGDFEKMKERFKKNIILLKQDETAAKAFYLMNETFNRNSEGYDYDSWRLFQIVFIVSQLRDIVCEEDRDTCELLHVMTGGGKSEAYFGIVVFTALYDRLSGKEFGVSGVTKFPLRMLSVQQLQRISNLFIFAEQVRKDYNLGGHPFSIAYLVGNQEDDFPRYNRQILYDIREKRDKNEKIKGKIIDECPLCAKKSEEPAKVFLDIDENQRLVIHKCENCGEEFRLYYSDDEIFRTLPTFIVSTVDKWAGIASNRRYRNLLGGDLDLCHNRHGFIPHNDTCGFEIAPEKECGEEGNPIKFDFDTSPTLIIQDEMHLIKEGFGTIDSHFETLIENMKLKLSGGSRFKNIVMTATVSGSENQIKNLYNKETRIFPPTLKNNDGKSFFFEELEEDGEKIVQRRFIGLKSSIQNFKLVFNILKYVSEFFTEIEEDLETFALDNDFDEDIKEVVLYYKNLLTYHNKKEAVHSISFSIDSMVNSNEDVYEVVTEPLTGENSLDDIKNVIHKVKHFYEDEENKDKILAVNSTSLVSHGVDLDEWNCMVFDGIPRSTSEYIQAFSRVGRKYFGIVFVSFSPMRTRDVSFYQHFVDYHKIINDKVENVPLSRWAKLGFKQTFTSVFNASILNYLSNEVGKPLHKAVNVLNVLDKEENKEKLINFIKEAYVLDSNISESEFFENEIIKGVDKRINVIEKDPKSYFFPNTLRKNPNKYFKTQFGMRGIQDEIVLKPLEDEDEFFLNYKEA